MVRLVRQTWLRKKAGNFVALRQLADRDQLKVRYELVQSRARNAEDAIAEWGFNPVGYSVRGATTCPYSGSPVTIRDAKAAGRAGQMRSQLMAVVCMQPGARGKRYVGADRAAPVDEEEIGRRLAELCQTAGMSVPDEQLPGISTEAGGIILPPAYGLDTFGKLFTLRQQLLLMALCKYAREAHRQLASELRDSALAVAVAAYLGLLVGRVADRASTPCHWDNSAEKTANTYARQALPMVWDFSEPNPFGGSSGDLDSQLDYIVEVIEHAAAAAPGRPAEVVRGRAQTLPLVVTDPPYYDNISYADLSDFFYVWHKRALGAILLTVFATSVTPKRAEIVAAPHRHDADKDRAAHFYESEMLQAFSEAHRVLRRGGPMVVVYAHRTTLGWATLVDSLRRSGFSVTEAWPLDTEMPDRAGQMKTAALASSVGCSALPAIDRRCARRSKE
jgi:putative DNA methylase